jgi:hypothetical protein
MSFMTGLTRWRGSGRLRLAEKSFSPWQRRQRRPAHGEKKGFLEGLQPAKPPCQLVTAYVLLINVDVQNQ